MNLVEMNTSGARMHLDAYGGGRATAPFAIVVVVVVIALAVWRIIVLSKRGK